MSESSEKPLAESLRSGGVVGERLRSAKSSYLGELMGKSDSWADKVRNSESGVMLNDLPALLAALNLKAVDHDKVCVDKEIYLSLRNIAGAALEAPQKLEWE